MGARIFEHPASLLIVLLIIVLLFGWKRLPDAARSVGRSMRIFKSEVSEMKNDGKTDTTTVPGETLNAQQAAAAEARRKAAEARAAAERAEREAAEAERNANGSTRL